jgi:hypothetical protein
LLRCPDASDRQPSSREIVHIGARSLILGNEWRVPDTMDQDLTVQRRAVRAAGCSVIRAEKKVATGVTGAPNRSDVTYMLCPRSPLNFYISMIWQARSVTA